MRSLRVMLMHFIATQPSSRKNLFTEVGIQFITDV